MSETAIRLHVERLDEGGYVATSPDVPGLVAEGRSIVEVVSIAQDITRKILESCIEHGYPIPPALQNLAEDKPDADIDIAVIVNLNSASAEAEKGWPEGFFERTAGSLKDNPIERPDQGWYEKRKELLRK